MHRRWLLAGRPRRSLVPRPPPPAPPSTAWRRQLAGVASAEPGLHQTPIVDALWKQRAEHRAERPSAAVPAASDARARSIVPKTPECSTTSVTYEFSNPENVALTDRYRNPWGHVRPGRLFEDLDALAGTIAFEHCRGDPREPDLHIVTASVDRIKYMYRPNLENDITLSGRVTWVGRSSMEIWMRAKAAHADEPFMESLFSFVARDPETGRAAQVNPLQVSDPEDVERFKLGAARDTARKEARRLAKSSLAGSSLDHDGLQAAHELLLRGAPLLSMPSLANPMDIFVSETRLQNTFLTMPQHRNTAGRIFGGFLMRRAYELARSTAHLFGGRRPIFHELDEVTFRAPISVGDMVQFEACVLYTSEDIDTLGRATIHTEVRASVLKPESRQTVLSNIFNFTFGMAENPDGTGGSVLGKDIELRRVLPATREEAYRIMERYVGDRRQVEEDRSLALSAPAAASTAAARAHQ